MQDPYGVSPLCGTVFVARSFVSVSSVPEPDRAVQDLGGQCAAEQPLRRAGVRHGRARPVADGPDHPLAGIPGGAAAGDCCKPGVSALPSQARGCGPGIFPPPPKKSPRSTWPGLGGAVVSPARCTCGKAWRGVFPPGVTASVPCGQRALVSRHGSDVVGCAQPSERSARRIAQPIPSVLASDATPRCASMASADRQMIGDATLATAV